MSDLANCLLPHAVKPTLLFRSIELRVNDLARMREFYIAQLGFVERPQPDVSANLPLRVELGFVAGGTTALTLREDTEAPAAPEDAAGLFHAAVRLPSRAALGRWLQRAAELGVNFQGFSDHSVSEAIYLSDPEGNGLEFYADRPRDLWPNQNGSLTMDTRQLDVRRLLAAAAPPNEPVLTGADWGHLHLRVSNLDRSRDFYAPALGVTPTQRYGASALFLAADGYHHHVGLNTWGGVHQSQPTGARGLIAATFERDGAPSTQSLRDPDGIEIRVAPLDAANAAYQEKS